MSIYQQMLSKYKKRQRETLVDTLSASLTFADNICVDVGILEDTGLLHDLMEGVCGALPFVIIAVTEQAKVILGKKTLKSGARDAAFRMAKTGAAIGAGACVAGTLGMAGAVPVTLGVRALFDKYRAKWLTGRRVMLRTARLRDIQTLRRKPWEAGEDIPRLSQEDIRGLESGEACSS